MGDLKVVGVQNPREKREFYLSVLDDLDTLDLMLKEGMIADGTMHIGAEQELCVVDSDCRPSRNGPDLLKEIPFSHYTNELGVFNLEINLDPYPLNGLCFELIQNDLERLLDEGERYARKRNDGFVLTGMLPTLQKKHLDFEYITPQPRYELLSKTLLELRGNDFQVHLQGVDEINSTLSSVLYEACNTSFQLHLQIEPDQFVDRYNWSQMIAGPVLSACVNSPILFGRELWSESRIALFKQSLDTRNFSNHIRTQMSRVSFGNDWIRHSFSDIYKDQVSRFPILLIKKDAPRSSEVLRKGDVPKLPYLLLHNGTTYSWNRPCYGTGEKQPHIRIECRYLPSGPSVPDEMANFAFWIGLMKGMPQAGRRIWEKVNFRSARGNFIKAARHGLEVSFDWFGENIPADKLLEKKLLPLAKSGLEEHGVNAAGINYYLDIIRSRVRSHRTGAQWITDNFRRLSERYSVDQSSQIITEYMMHHRNDPVHLWQSLPSTKSYNVAMRNRSVMACLSGDLITVRDDVPVSLANRIFEWKNIHHILVEDKDRRLIGILSTKDLERISEPEKSAEPVGEIMSVKPVTISIDKSPEEALRLMLDEKVNSLPVFEDSELVGIITMNDLERCNISIQDNGNKAKLEQSINQNTNIDL